MNKRILTGLLAVGLMTTALMGGGIALAAIPDADDGRVYGCYQKNNGQLRVIDQDAADACLPSEEPLFWNQRGPRGPRGPQGRPGPRGPEGPAPGFYFREASNSGVANNKAIDVSCDPGDEVTGGGVYVRGSGDPAFTQGEVADHINIVENRKLGGNSLTWRARAHEVPYDTNPVGQKGWTLTAQVFCADVTT